MKSYFLEGLNDERKTRRHLSHFLPHQTDPWLILAPSGDPIAYLNVVTEPGKLSIQADISGRHHNEDLIVLDMLRRLQGRLGGEIKNDDEAPE